MSKSYLVTGANRGIGLELSRQIILTGNKLIALCRNPSKATELNSLVEQSAGLGKVYRADVRDEIALNRISNEITDHIDVVICNAGITGAAPAGIFDPNNNAVSIRSVLMTNIAGPFFITKSFLKQLSMSQEPKIFIMSSIMGSSSHPGATSYFYRASKAGANNIMITLSKELEKNSITVVSVHPGWVQTDMGGKNAQMTSEESATALLDLFNKVGLDDTGSFLNYNGEKIPL